MAEVPVSVELSSQADAPVEPPCTALVDVILDVIRRPSLRDSFRTLLASDIEGCVVGWPRRTTRGEGPSPPANPNDAETWLRAGDLLVELARTPASSAFELGISLHAESATRLCDRLLGAHPGSSIAGRAGQLRDAECGLLAYAAARLAASHGGGWTVRDVRPAVGHACLAGAVAWPLAMTTSMGRLDAVLWISSELAEALPARHLLEVVLHEQSPRGQSVPRPGDVWISDSWLLTHTTTGLTGPVVLRTPSCDTSFHARLIASHVLALRTRSPQSDDDLEVVIAKRVLRLLELADLTSGAHLFIDEPGRHPVVVRRANVPIARGQLIRWGGALGVRVTDT